MDPEFAKYIVETLNLIVKDISSIKQDVHGIKEYIKDQHQNLQLTGDFLKVTNTLLTHITKKEKELKVNESKIKDNGTKKTFNIYIVRSFIPKSVKNNIITFTFTFILLYISVISFFSLVTQLPFMFDHSTIRLSL